MPGSGAKILRLYSHILILLILFKMSKTFSILVCALNEERNIGLLLRDILEQKYDESFKERFAPPFINVVSDGSTDKTVEIVQDLVIQYPAILLTINQKRIGKIYSLANAFQTLTSDYVVLFDADVRLQTDTIQTLLQPFGVKKYDLVAGNPVPNRPSSFFNVAEQASYFSWILLQRIKKKQPNSVYSAHGRILALTKSLYKRLDISTLSTPGDDQFMYFNSHHNFYYQKKAVVTYKMPASINDYLKQNVRFRLAKDARYKFLEQEIVKREFFIPNKLGIFIKTFLDYPYQGIFWSFAYISGKAMYLFKKSDTNMNNNWGEVTSTK